MSALDRVQALAKAHARWCVDEDGDPDPQFDVEPGEWLVRPLADGRVEFSVWGPPPLREWTVDDHTAELALRCRATGRRVTRVCPDCEGGKRWRVVGSLFRDDELSRADPCPTCSAKGRVSVDLCQVVLEAARECDECSGGVRVQTNPRTGDQEDIPCANCIDGFIPGSPTARTELACVADVLMNPIDEGKVCAMTEADHVLGQALALWLAGAPCEGCVRGRSQVLSQKLLEDIQSHGRDSLRQGFLLYMRHSHDEQWRPFQRQELMDAFEGDGCRECETCGGHGTASAARLHARGREKPRACRTGWSGARQPSPLKIRL